MLLLVLLEKVSEFGVWSMRLVADIAGLNVEQRKRLSIGVELVARPALLLFLDEPTSGLDSQTSWNILQLLRKLAAHGQAILCTIHQPSAILFEQFDRLLFLARGGKTVYYGQVGQQSRILIDYFERNGATSYKEGENPAEWMLEAIGAAPGTKSDVDWHQQWLNSPERVVVREELDQMEQNPKGGEGSEDASAYSEFAAPFGEQLTITLKRSWWQLWRSPSYIYSKLVLCAISVCPFPGSRHKLTSKGLYIGFSFFGADRSQQGVQSQLFSVFMVSHFPGFPRAGLKSALPPLWSTTRTNVPHLHHVSINLRSPRTTFQNLFMESIHVIQHPH